MREQLRPEADAEHRDTADRGVAQELRLGGQERIAIDVADRLVAPEGDDPVGLVDGRQRVSVEQTALVELSSRGPKRRSRVARERVGEVVQNGDDLTGHASEGTDTRSRGFGLPHPH